MINPTADLQTEARRLRKSPLIGPTDLDVQASQDIAGGMNGILADVFALCLVVSFSKILCRGQHFYTVIGCSPANAA